jgi:DNA-binding NarL/FixJ family response regulator
MTDPIRVGLVDDQTLLRMGLRMILEVEPDIEVVGEAEDGAGAIELAEELRPDVLLMDVRMPGIDGITATATIRAGGGPTRILILTTFDLDSHVYAGLQAGASGFLLKDTAPAQLLAAVRTVAAGDSVLAPSATRRLLEAFTPQLEQLDPARRNTVLGPLTDREREVLGHIAGGKSNREIAGLLHLSEGTVKVHVGRILAKLDLRDRVQAVVLAYEIGLVTPGREPGST